MNIPLTADELIDQLARENPEVIYDPAMDREEFLLQSGARRLVVSLQHRREDDDRAARGERV